MEKNKTNPIAEVFSYAHDKKLIGLSVFLAVIAVLRDYSHIFAASYLVTGLINKTLTINLVLALGDSCDWWIPIENNLPDIFICLLPQNGLCSYGRNPHDADSKAPSLVNGKGSTTQCRRV